MRRALVILLLVTRLPIAHAETDQPEEKSPLLGLGLSVTSTALPLAAIGALWQSGNAEEHLGLWSLNWIAAFLGPSVGHWYAGEYLTPGLVGRGIGGVALVVGVGMSLNCLGSQNPDCETNRTGGVVVVSGIALMVGGAIYDIATSPRAVHRWNRSHLQIVPTPVGTGSTPGFGMAVAGTF